MRVLSVGLGLLGLAAFTLVLGYFGVARVAEAAISVGWQGLGLLSLYQIGIFVLLGLAWWSIAPARSGLGPGGFIWSRMVRDASGQLLPFSALGGFVLGARAANLHGLSWPVATASTIVDVTAEFLAEMVFIAAGLVVLAVRHPHSPLIVPLGAGLMVALLFGTLFVVMQHGTDNIFRFLAPRIGRAWFHDAADHVTSLQDALSGIYRRPGRLALCTMMHLGGWLLTAGSGWLGFRFLGIPARLPDVIGLEALVQGSMTLAFVVPGAIGVQEGAFAGFASLFGLPPDGSLAVSLVMRARQVAVGVPVLLIWQFVELRRFRRRDDQSRAAEAKRRTS